MKRFVWKCPQCRRVGLVWEAKCGICAESVLAAHSQFNYSLQNLIDGGEQESPILGVARSLSPYAQAYWNAMEAGEEAIRAQDAQNRLYSQTQAVRQRWPGLGVQWP